MAHNATASTSAPNYHIFINHRGCDVKKTFAGYLYRRLTNTHGLRVFLDRPELEAGKRILSQIEQAIKVASVEIAIFSENYANSKWCLDELRLMVDSEKRGATILPVFYNIKPSDLRWADAAQDGPYAQALLKHEEKGRYDPRRIQGWKEALSQVSYISGFELEACNGDEADLLEKVVERVLTKVPKVPETELHVAKYATGLGEKIEDFEKTALSQREEQPVEAMVVGIAGVGGIGKTTLANEFFNCKRSHYDGSSFLPDVREKASRSFLPSLQSKLIKDLKGIDKEIDRCEQGIGVLKEHLKSYRALIIIDDVDDADQLDSFLPIKGVLHPKSLILVTSRDKHVLRSAGIRKSSIYHLKGLSESHSQELFCSHAFFQPHPLPGFENLVLGFVKSCDGLPLSLKVFGALLCGQEQHYWEEKMKELHRLPDKILASLKISYNSLNQEEQQIFLDIACFAIGKDRDKWVRIWGGFTGLQTLEDRCLVDIEVVDEDYGEKMKQMRMHDHVRDMGRNIAEEVSMPRRLWRSVEEVHDLFEEQSLSSVIPDVRGITIPRRWNSTIAEEALLLNKISSEPAIKIRALQLLESEGEFVEGIIRRVRSPNLIWLRWNKCPCSSLPTWIPMDQLKVLEVKGTKLKKLWRRDYQAPLQLRELYVEDAPLLEFPKSIGKLTHLEKIVFRNLNYVIPPPEPAADLSTLPTLPEGFFHLRSLKYLELDGHFRILPKEFGNLKNLQSIVLCGCQRMEKLPDSFKDLTNLQVLQLYTCNSLKRLPKSLGDLTNLQRISLYECGSLELLPNSFANLANLQHLCLSGCNRLKRLPNSLGDLTNLQRITLKNCEGLEVLPESFGCLTNLLRVKLTGCKRLKNLPDSFTGLRSLQHLKLSDSDKLKRLPKSLGCLTNLQCIDLARFPSLKKLPNSMGDLTNLQEITLSSCGRLKRLPNSFGDLTNLQRITFSNCEGLEVLPESFGCLINLLSIELTGCKTLKKLPDSFTGLTSLQHLKLSGSDRLKRLPKSLGCLTNLQDIILSNCKSLKKLPNSLGDLTNLQEIRLDKCESLEVLPDSFGNLKNLQRTTLQDSGLKTIPDSFQNLTNLVSIDLGACRSLKMLPNNLFGNLTNLETVRLSGCESLEKLPHFLGNLTEFRSIQLNGCKSLKKLPKSLGELTNLRGIDLSRCKSLKKLPNSLGNLSQLRFLDLSHCSTCSIALPGNMTTLQLLDLSGCVQMAALPAQVEHQKSLELLNLVGTNLKEFNAQTACLSNLKYLFLGSPLLKELPPSFGCLSSLEVLLLHGCQELKRLPDSFALLTQLTRLEISKCGIHDLPGLMEMNNLETLRVRGCPLRELPFKEESAPRRKRKRRTSEKALIRVNFLELYCTEVREVSFPEGVCINLQTLRIMCCNDLVKVGSLPATVERLILRGCGALGKVEGLSGLANPWEVDLRGCCNIEMGEVPHFGNTTRLFIPTDTYNPQEEEDVEKDMAALQEGVLPGRFARRLGYMKRRALNFEL